MDIVTTNLDILCAKLWFY